MLLGGLVRWRYRRLLPTRLNVTSSRLVAQAVVVCICCVGDLVSLLAPLAPGSDRPLVAVEDAAGIAVALVELSVANRLGERSARVTFHAVNVLGVLGTTSGILVAPGFADALAYAAPLGIVALFCTTTTVVAYVVLIAACCFLGLVAHPETAWLGDELVLVGSCAALAWLFRWGRNQLERLSKVDPLCRVLNRSGLQERLHAEIALARRAGTPLSLAVVDLDDFKSINDRDGHEAGDELLQALARTWQGELRADDVLARLGGDEFVVALPGCDGPSARALVARLVDAGAQPASVGVAELRPGEEPREVLRRADLAMLAAKRARIPSTRARRGAGGASPATTPGGADGGTDGGADGGASRPGGGARPPAPCTPPRLPGR